MTTEKQRRSNRANALVSTGPTSAEGKARSAGNALRHGVRSSQPVIPGESPDAWERHRAGVVTALGPDGALEHELATRVALCLWRLRRLTGYETAVTADGIDTADADVRRGAGRAFSLFAEDAPPAARLEELAEELSKAREVADLWSGTARLHRELAALSDTQAVDAGDVEGFLSDIRGELDDDAVEPDDERFLQNVGLPAAAAADPYSWDGWTAGLVRRVAVRLAELAGADPDRTLTAAGRSRHEIADGQATEVRRIEAEAEAARRDLAAEVERVRRKRVLPAKGALDTVMRYEAHLMRQVSQALHTLERLQAARSGRPPAPPVVVDVLVDGDPGPART